MDPNACRNPARSGFVVREADIRAAFEFLDAEGRGIIKASTLRKRLGAFYRNIGARVRLVRLSVMVYPFTNLHAIQSMPSVRFMHQERQIVDASLLV